MPRKGYIANREVLPDVLIDLSIVFNKMLRGLTIEEIDENVINNIKGVVGNGLKDEVLKDTIKNC